MILHPGYSFVGTDSTVTTTTLVISVASGSTTTIAWKPRTLEERTFQYEVAEELRTWAAQLRRRAFRRWLGRARAFDRPGLLMRAREAPTMKMERWRRRALRRQPGRRAPARGDPPRRQPPGVRDRFN